MSAYRRLVIFDVDGTLVDSQALILTAFAEAFAAIGADLPDRDRVLGEVGLSLEVIMPRLLPEASEADHAKMVTAYKAAYMAHRSAAGIEKATPFYPGAREALEALHATPDVILGIATGKSRRGLDKLIEGHGLEGMFVTEQVSDFHPSKPHPSMVLQAMKEAGVGPEHTVMIGDTSYDMEMAVSAGVRGVGVTWGFHDAKRLEHAACLIDEFAALGPALANMWGMQA